MKHAKDVHRSKCTRSSGAEALNQLFDGALARLDAVAADFPAADAGRLGGALRAATVAFPPSWTAQIDDGGDRGDIGWWRDGRQLVTVDKATDAGAAEWAEVNDLLRASVPSATLVRLEARGNLVKSWVIAW